MNKLMKGLLGLTACALLAACGGAKTENSSAASSASQAATKTIDLVLDYTPNTNHTGLYVAKEKGYFKEVSLDLDIKLPPEGGASDLVINGTAPFAIDYQDMMAKKIEKDAPITAVAAIIEHNTSGIISLKKDNITQPKDLAGKSYGTWNDPMELAMIKSIMELQGADFSSVKIVPNTDYNSVASIQNGQFQAAWIFYAWDGVLAKESMKMDTNFFYLKDFNKTFDYYTPVLIANNDYLKNNPEEAKKVVQAIKKGYQYAMENPEESADILIKYAPELKEQRDFIVASQKYLAGQYTTSGKEKWGEFDASRWNNFYKWLHEVGVVTDAIPENRGFSNDYVK